MKKTYDIIKEIQKMKSEFGKHNGITIEEINDGHAKVSMPVQPFHMNPIGSVHGGCLFTMADLAAGAAAASHGEAATTVNADVHFLRTAIGAQTLYAEAMELKRGKRIWVYDVAVSDQDGKVLFKGTFTYMPIARPANT